MQKENQQQSATGEVKAGILLIKQWKKCAERGIRHIDSIFELSAPDHRQVIDLLLTSYSTDERSEGAVIKRICFQEARKRPDCVKDCKFPIPGTPAGRAMTIAAIRGYVEGLDAAIDEMETRLRELRESKQGNGGRQ